MSAAGSTARARSLQVLLLLLLVPLLVTWPALPRFASHLPMAPEYEGAVHAWGLWAALREGAPLVLDSQLLAWPEGSRVVLVDPANLPAFALGQLLGGVAGGVTLLTWTGIALAGLAGALLGRELDGDPRLGALAAMLATPVLCAGADGITEDLALGWVGIQLALLLRFLRTGRAADGAGAAVALAVAWYGGPYNGMLASLVDLAVGLGLVVRRDRRVARAALVAAGAVLLVAPLARAVLLMRPDALPGGATRTGLPAPDVGPDRFRGGLMTGADLLDPWLPAPLTGAVAAVPHSAYLGVVALVAAIVVVWRQPRRWPWLAGIVGLVLVALGPHLSVAGRPVDLGSGPLLAPAGMLIAAAEGLGRITRWYRAAGVASLLLAGLVAAAPRSGRTALLLAGGLVLDALLLAPVAWPRPSSPMPPATPWGELPAPARVPGAILELPLTTSGSPGPGSWRDVGALDQTHHGRPVGGNLLGQPPSAAARRGNRAVQRLMLSGELPASEGAAIVDAGFAWLVLRPHYLRLGDQAWQHLESCFGPALFADEDMRIHALGGGSQGCPASDREDR